jgi:hypothetical protein
VVQTPEVGDLFRGGFQLRSLQGLKPLLFGGGDVAAEAATHKAMGAGGRAWAMRVQGLASGWIWIFVFRTFG